MTERPQPLSAPPAASDLAEREVVAPTRPALAWLARAVLSSWRLDRVGISVVVFATWAVPASLPVHRPGTLSLLASLLPVSLLGTIGLLLVSRSVVMELGVDRLRRSPAELGYAMEHKRSAAIIALISAALATSAHALGDGALPALQAWAVATGLWWCLVLGPMSAIAADAADTIDAVQRCLAFIARAPLIALGWSLPLIASISGVVSLGWASSRWHTPDGAWIALFAALGGGVLVSHAVSLAVAGYFALRYAADRQDPSEILGSGVEGGVLADPKGERGA